LDRLKETPEMLKEMPRHKASTMRRRLLLFIAASVLPMTFAAGYVSAGYLDRGVSDFSARSR
jgi:hypothetical protein